MAVKNVVQAVPVVEYDGGNGQDIIDAINPDSVTEYDIELTSESGGEAVFSWAGGTFTAAAGDWVRVGNISGNWGIFTESGARSNWVEIPAA